MDLSVKALEATYGTRFTYGTIENVICKKSTLKVLAKNGIICFLLKIGTDQASGNTADYAYVVEKILYSYALELRDTGRYGITFYDDRLNVNFSRILSTFQNRISFAGRSNLTHRHGDV